MKIYFVYMLASRSGVLYAGITSDLQRRVAEHKAKLYPGFTAKYNCERLVWYECFTDVNEAIATEKRIKGWRRSKKVALIVEENPAWADLSICAQSIPPAPEVPRFARDDHFPPGL